MFDGSSKAFVSSLRATPLHLIPLPYARLVTAESDAEEFAARILRDFAVSIDKIEARRELQWRVRLRSESELGADDTAMAPLAISTQVQTALMLAVDHLQGAADILGRNGDKVRLRLVALFPLLRSALECASTALYLLAPDEPDERRSRSMRLYWNDCRQDAELYEELKRAAAADGGPLVVADNSEAHAKNQSTVSAGAAQLGLSSRRYREGIGYRTIVERAGEAAGVGGARARFVWHQISGLTHPQMTRINTVVDRQPVENGDPYLETAVVTVNASAVAFALDTVMRVYIAAEQEHQHRAHRSA